jgi:hypothetical protein
VPKEEIKSEEFTFRKRAFAGGMYLNMSPEINYTLPSVGASATT